MRLPCRWWVESSLRITSFVLQLFSLCDLKCICLPAETLLLHVIRAEDLTAIRVPLLVFLLMQNLHVHYLCLCYGLQAQHERESKIYLFIKERKVLSKNNMVNPGICKCWTPVDEWVRYLPGEMILGKDYHWPWECRQQTRNPKELWPLCNQAALHPRPSWLCNGKRESISSYSAANQSSESTRQGREDCISLCAGGGRRNSWGMGWNYAWSKEICFKREAACYAALWNGRTRFLLLYATNFCLACVTLIPSHGSLATSCHKWIILT